LERFDGFIGGTLVGEEGDYDAFIAIVGHIGPPQVVNSNTAATAHPPIRLSLSAYFYSNASDDPPMIVAYGRHNFFISSQYISNLTELPADSNRRQLAVRSSE
jgi:hypothetical protein